MGAIGFMTFFPGETAEEAFHGAVEEAEYEYGQPPYTGTISEKDSFTVITESIVPQGVAEDYAEQLLRSGDSRINGKDDPAGAIPVVGNLWLFFGMARY